MPNPHWFTRLPLELREEIWKFAIPSRVIELDIPHALGRLDSHPATEFICDIRSTSRLNARKPTIAYVCREARQVVMKHGCHLRDLLPPTHDPRWINPQESYQYLTQSDCELNAWCSPGLDSIHLSWSALSMGQSSERWRCARPIQPVQLLHSCNDHARRLSVYFNGIHPLGPINEKPAFRADSTSTELLYFQAGKEYYAVLKVFCVHLSMQDVVKTGLFGKGEQRIVLVDVQNTEEIQRYTTALHRSYSRIESDDVTFLDHISRRPNKLQVGGKWEQDLRKLWVWSKWFELRGVQYFDVTKHGRTWPFVTINDNYPTFRYGYSDSDELFREELNLDDNWVLSTLASMPKFVPAVMFRFCEDPVCEQRLWDADAYNDYVDKDVSSTLNLS